MSTETIQAGNRLIAEFESLGYSIDHTGSVLGRRGKILKLAKRKGKYIQVNCFNNRLQKTYLVHRLVASKFIPNPDNLPEVNHKDGDKWNNHKDNLEWSTRENNIKHGFDTGLITPPWKGKGGKGHPRSKRVLQCNMSGLTIKEFGSSGEASRVTNINKSHIQDVCRGRGVSAGGYKWRYNSTTEVSKSKQ